MHENMHFEKRRLVIVCIWAAFLDSCKDLFCASILSSSARMDSAVLSLSVLISQSFGTEVCLQFTFGDFGQT